MYGLGLSLKSLLSRCWNKNSYHQAIPRMVWKIFSQTEKKKKKKKKKETDKKLGKVFMLDHFGVGLSTPCHMIAMGNTMCTYWGYHSNHSSLGAGTRTHIIKPHPVWCENIFSKKKKKDKIWARYLCLTTLSDIYFLFVFSLIFYLFIYFMSRLNDIVSFPWTCLRYPRIREWIG